MKARGWFWRRFQKRPLFTELGTCPYITGDDKIDLTNSTMNRTINAQPKMDKVIGIAKLRDSLASIIKEVNKGAHYIIVQRSKAKAVLLSPDEVETLEVLADRRLLEEILEAKKDILEGKFTTYEDFFGKKLPKKH